MGNKNLESIYGRGYSRDLINKAVRRELVGGDDALDALVRLCDLRQKWVERGWTEGLPDIETAIAAMDRFVHGLKGEIRRRYGLPPE